MMESTYKILKYLRLSLDDEGDGESNSIQYQRKLIDSYIEEQFKDRKIFVDEIVDDGYSGTNFKRPGITRALELLNAGKFNCIIVKDLSRFGRDHIQVGNYLEHIFPAMEIRVISINDQYDSDEHIGSPGGIDIALKNLIYELYSKDLSQKVKAARRTMMKKGKFNAPYAFYGYQKYNDSLIIDAVSGRVMMRLFDLLDSGKSTTEVATIFNAEGIPTPAEYKKMQNCKRKWNYGDKKACWTDVTVRRLATDERYTGKSIFGKTERTKVGDPCSAKLKPKEEWIIVDATHPALVTQEKFDRVGERIHTRHNHHGNSVNHKPSIYCCGYCGHTLQKSGKKNVTLKCRYSVMSSQTECLCDGIKLKELQELLKTVLSKQFAVMRCEAKQYKTSISAGSGVSLDVIQREVAKLKKQRFNAYEKFKNGDMSREEFDESRESIGKRMEELEQISKKVDNEVEVSEIKTHKADTILNYGNEEEFDENFINYFIKRVKVHSNKVIDITWNFGLDEFIKESGGQLYA